MSYNHISEQVMYELRAKDAEEIMDGATPLEDTLTDTEIDLLYCEIDAVCDDLGLDEDDRDEARMSILGLVERWVPTDCDHCGEPFQPLQERCHKSCAC